MSIERIGVHVPLSVSVPLLAVGLILIVYAFYSGVYEDKVEKSQSPTGELNSSAHEVKRRKRRDVFALVSLFFGGFFAIYGFVMSAVYHNDNEFEIRGKVDYANVTMYDQAGVGITAVGLQDSDDILMFYSKSGEAELAKNFPRDSNLTAYCNLTDENARIYSCTTDENFNVEQGGVEFLSRINANIG